MPIEAFNTLPANDRKLAFKFKGKLNGDDAREVYQAIGSIAEQGHSALLLFDLREYEGFGFDLVLEKLRHGPGIRRQIQRTAVVGGKSWMPAWVGLGAALSPIEIAHFETDRENEAVDWLEEGSHLEYSLDDAGVLKLTPHGPLRQTDFEALRTEVDAYLETHGKLTGVLVDAGNFPGWENFAAAVEHLRFVGEHHRQIEKVAVVSDAQLAKHVPRVLGFFVAAEIRHFDRADLDKAHHWLRG